MIRNGRYAHIVGWGMYVPTCRRSNQEIAPLIDVSDEWILQRTGIKERRIAADDESTATLAAQAARSALEVAELKPGEVDLIIVASSTPEHLFPATACLVQDALGAERAGAFDLSAACSGFVYALSVAAHSVQIGAIDTALVIGSETTSRFVDWRDRDTAILFGDGAGAVVLQARDTRAGVLSCTLRARGSGGRFLVIPAGGSRHPPSSDTDANNQHTVKMQGQQVFRFATTVVAEATRTVVEKEGLTLEDVTLVVPHQASSRIIQSAARRLKMPQDRFFLNLERYGNTSSASIPIALCEAIEKGRVKPGDNLVLVGFGAGLAWGAALVEWAAH